MKGLFLALVFGLTVTPMPSSAQMEAVTAAVASDRLDATLSGVITNAGSTANVAVFNAASEARLLLQSWRRENSAMMQETLDHLDSSSANAFANLQSTADQLNAGGIDAEAAAQRFLDGAQQLASTVTLSNRPIVTKVSPTYLVPGVNAPVEIRFFGVNLDKPKASRLGVAGTEPLAPVSGLQRELHFVVPNALRMKAAPAAGTPVNMTLSMVTPHPNWWRRTFGGTELINYKVQILLLPTELAQVEVSYAKKGTTLETRDRNEKFYYNRGGRKRSRACEAKPIRPFDGYKIDVNSVRTTYSTGVHGSFSIESLTPEGFIGKSCASSGSRDSGYKDTHLAWTEYRDVPVLGGSRIQQQMKMGWTEDVVIKLPDAAAKPEVAVKVFDGRVFRINNTRDEGFVRAVFDASTNTFTLHPIASKYAIESR